MSFMDKVRGQFIDIVEFLDDSRDTLVWRFPRQGNEIKMGAQLVVREGQAAVFVNEGEIADVFTPGTYTLETENLPVLSDLKGWKYGFNSPFKAEVYFVGTRQYTDFKWGTQNPVTLRDSEFGMVRLRAFGTYALQVTDPAKLLRQLVGTDPQFRTEEVAEFLRQNVVAQFANAVAAAHIPVLDLAANQLQIAGDLATTLTSTLADYGVTIPKFIIENISLPDEVGQALDKRTEMGVLGDLDTYTRLQAANALGDAANNPGGAGEGVGLGVGVAIGQQMAGLLTGGHPTDARTASPETSPGTSQETGPAAAGPPPLPATAWYVGVHGQQKGPLTSAALAEKVTGGEVTAETLVWRQGMPAWTPAGQLPELATLFGTVPPPLPPQA